MVIQEGTSSIDINVVERSALELPRGGDVNLSVTVASSGFAGATTVWVDAEALASFLQRLRALDRDRAGAAVLEGMSPGAFQLEIRAVGVLGHMAIDVVISRRVRGAHAGPYAHELHVAFEFSPSLLSTFITSLSSDAGAQGQ
jgi:hypothetical protein